MHTNNQLTLIKLLSGLISRGPFSHINFNITNILKANVDIETKLNSHSKSKNRCEFFVTKLFG